MTSHDSAQPDIATDACTYAAGAMSAAEAAAFEARLAALDGPAMEAFAGLAPVVAELLAAVEPVAPSDAVRAALLARVAQDRDAAAEVDAHTAGDETADADDRRQVWKRWSDDAVSAHLVIQNAMRTGWEDTDIPGIAVRRLSVDRERNQTTMLVRMAAGTGYPSHIHDGPEECLVLEGDLRVGDEHHLHAGDFQRMAPGSRHGYQSTDGGCLLLIVSSLSDKLD